jgi:hypothetical protein
MPSIGPYCLYRAAGGGGSQDCANTNRTARSHADFLSGAGVDYVVVHVDPGLVGGGSSVETMRPLEVLLEEWRNLRAAGVSTPSVALCEGGGGVF